MDEPDKTVHSDFRERIGSDRLIHYGTVRVRHPSFVEKLIQTRDISESGAFLFYDWAGMPPHGSVIEIQLRGRSESTPRVSAKLIRFCKKGVGVAFCDE